MDLWWVFVMFLISSLMLLWMVLMFEIWLYLMVSFFMILGKCCSLFWSFLKVMVLLLFVLVDLKSVSVSWFSFLLGSEMVFLCSYDCSMVCSLFGLMELLFVLSGDEV